MRSTENKDESDGRDALRVWGVAVALAVIGLAVTLPFVGAPPPDSIRVAAGPEEGAYFEAAQDIARDLAEAGIEVEVLATSGSVANLAALSGDVDVAFVQGGIAEKEREDIQGVASLYYEPLWIFVRAGLDPEQLTELERLAIEVGAEGSGTRAVATDLLRANGVTEGGGTSFGGRAPEPAVEALLAGEADALFLVVAPSSPLVRRLHEAASTGRVTAVSLARAHAYSRHFRYLEPLTLTPGMIDLEENLPPAPVEMVAPTAGLLAAADLHPAVVPLLIGAAERRFGAGGLFEDEGEFPNPRDLDPPPGVAALHYYEHGRSFVYRVLPFQVAAALDRLKILLLPMITLLFPLIRFASPLYRWRVRSRIIRWYQFVMRIDRRVTSESTHEELQAALAELAELSEEIRAISVPLSYAEELYNLKMHLHLVERYVLAELDDE